PLSLRRRRSHSYPQPPRLVEFDDMLSCLLILLVFDLVWCLSLSQAEQELAAIRTKVRELILKHQAELAAHAKAHEQDMAAVKTSYGEAFKIAMQKKEEELRAVYLMPAPGASPPATPRALPTLSLSFLHFLASPCPIPLPSSSAGTLLESLALPLLLS